MSIRKDIDDMLNGLKGNSEDGTPDSGTDDLLTSLNDKKSAGIKSDAPKKLAPLSPRRTSVPKKPASSSDGTKKKIVISSELPDYDAIREKELAKEAERKAREEAERKAREEAEQKAREEAERKAREEAEQKAREEAERKAREEAERKAREEAERKAREEAEQKALEEAERKAREEAEQKAREEAERKAREEAEQKAREEAERKAREEAERKAREEAKRKEREERKKARRKARSEERKKAREEAERKKQEKIEQRQPEADEFTVEEITEINQIDESDEYESILESDPVGSLIDNMREDTEKAFAEIDKGTNDSDNPESSTPEENTSENAAEETVPEAEDEKAANSVSGFFEQILDEDPDNIINERKEKAVSDKGKKSGGNFKKNFYAFCGVVFAVFACVGFITVVSKGISMISGYTSGDSKKNGFESVVYPVVIMDIDSFETPAELPSDQIITAAIWSMIMSEDAIKNYEMTFDVVKIPAVDVESYAVKLFGENLPELTHTTVGPAESRFYYNEETQAYNVPVAPVTYTYSPEIKGATKNGSNYTIVVEYMDELPNWLPQTSSKSVEFKLTETNDGYTIDSMKILSTTSSGAL